MAKLDANGEVVDVSYQFKTEALMCCARVLNLCEALQRGDFSHWEFDYKEADELLEQTKSTITDDEEDTIAIKIEASLPVVNAKKELVVLKAEHDLPYDLDCAEEKSNIQALENMLKHCPGITQ